MRGTWYTMHFLFLIKNIFNQDKDLENKKHLIFFLYLYLVVYMNVVPSVHTVCFFSQLCYVIWTRNGEPLTGFAVGDNLLFGINLIMLSIPGKPAPDQSN